MLKRENLCVRNAWEYRRERERERDLRFKVRLLQINASRQTVIMGEIKRKLRSYSKSRVEDSIAIS
jgi:hypothetical protein